MTNKITSRLMAAHLLMRCLRFVCTPLFFFLACGLVFGVLFLALTPPYQVADEHAHAYRAWQVSRGNIVHGRVHGPVPAAFLDLNRHFNHLPFHKDQKVEPERILELLRSGESIDPAETRRVRSNAFVYSPVPYLASGFGMRLATLLELPAAWSIYLGRACNLLAWAALMALAIHVLPALKWELAFLALLPMSVFQGMSLSADAVNNALSFLGIALLVSLFLREKVPLWQLGALSLVFVLMAWSKQVYALPFLLVVFARGSFSSNRRFLIYSGATCACILLASLWPLLNDMPGHPHIAHDPAKALSDLFRSWLTPVIVLLMTVDEHLFRLMEALVGKLGWLDTRLPGWVIAMYWWALAGVALVLCNVGQLVTRRLRLAAFAVFAAISCLLVWTMFILWPRNAFYIAEGLQGRYFLPAMPLLLLAFAKQRDPLAACLERRFPILTSRRLRMGYAAALWLVSLAGLGTSALVLHHRYFF